MFINASGRTDIAAYYSEWFMNRIREGYVYARNPLYPNKVSRYQLSSDVVDCIIFCSKNPEPMIEHLPELMSRGYHVLFQVTITSYGQDMEPRVPDYHQVMDTFQILSEKAGKNNLYWRYDPILITPEYTVDYHLHCFDEMSCILSPYTDYCIFSFVQMYKKLSYTFPELRGVTLEEKKLLLQGMSEIAAKYHIQLQTCGDGNDYAAYGIHPSGCITIPILKRAIGKELKSLPSHPARNGCGCIHTNDIGAYDTCPHGCRYCYATNDHTLAMENYKKHDPKSPLLIGTLRPDDMITESRQKSYIIDDGQMTLDL